MLSLVMPEEEFEGIRRYYQNKAVRERIREFCGGEDISAEYFVGFGESLAREGYRRPLKLVPDYSYLAGLMDQGLDLFRSVWDKSSTLAVWDVEYFNLDTWAGIYSDQLTYFELMEPTYRAIEATLTEYGIPCINDSTASGYHFISRIPFSSPVHARLEEVGYLEESLSQKYASVPGGYGKRNRPLPERDGRGYSAIGRLMEFLSHRVIRRARTASSLFITISDAARGRSPRGREGMSLDITQYADPLYMRDIRMSFSTHQKNKIYIGKVGIKNARETGVYATLPRRQLSYRELLPIRSDLRQAAEYAEDCSGLIPDGAAGWDKVIRDYRASSLYSFHREFDAGTSKLKPGSYRKPDFASLPACVVHPTRNANTGLLNPTNLQTVCRILMSRGWKPHEIAGLVRSYYERDLAWHVDWKKYHAATKANFWVRIYCGMIVGGIDDLKDFDCLGQSEKGFCPNPWCGFRLRDFRRALRDIVNKSPKDKE